MYYKNEFFSSGNIKIVILTHRLKKAACLNEYFFFDESCLFILRQNQS